MEPAVDTETLIVMAIRRIVRAIDLHSRRLYEQAGLTAPQIAVLHVIGRLEPVTVGVIAREARISAATTTGILGRLEKRGLICRRRGADDRRTVEAELTSEGREALVSAPSLLQDRFRDELARLEGWERSMLLSSLQRIALLMDVEELDASPHLVANALNNLPDPHQAIGSADEASFERGPALASTQEVLP
jgi:DNA-binding MarR family transcriptional regulator